MKYSSWSIPKGPAIIPKELLAAGYSPLMSALLALRDINTKSEAESYLCGSLDCLGDPFVLKDMEKAVFRINRAISQNEKVAVYGDYDVDGISATALLVKYLRSKGLSCEGYIPDRLDEGYGLNTAALQSIYEGGASLVITVDCGVTASEEAEFAKSLGLDLIITDHHEHDGNTLPDCCAVVDPKIEGNPKNLEILAGVGVAFKLVCALEKDADIILNKYADLVALGTVADVMPMHGENRYIVRRGLDLLSESKSPGLKMLVEESCGNRKLNANAISYLIAPRLNAAGRLGCADISLKLLLTEDIDEAARLTAELEELNSSRRDIEQRIWDEAKNNIGSKKIIDPIVLASETWHRGVIGIAASKLAEKYSVPAVMICLEEETGKGSCRSYGGFNIYEALSACSVHLESFGGHAFAAGLTIKKSRISGFRAALADYYKTAEITCENSLNCDLIINDPKLLSFASVDSLEQLEPWGSGNESPELYLPGATLERAISIGGGKHIKLQVSKGDILYDCVMFSRKIDDLGAAAGDIVDIVFNPQINEYRGNRSVQLVLTDLRLSDENSDMLRILQNGKIEPWELMDICPERADFIKVWRNIESAGGELSGTADALAMLFGEEIRVPKAAICLLVFGDLGLLEIECNSDWISINKTEPSGKVDIMSHPLISEALELRESFYYGR